MPFYEYQCNSCGHTLEAMQKLSDAPLKKCPHCGKAQLTAIDVGAGISPEGRGLVRNRLQVGPRQQAQSRGSAGRGSVQGREERDRPRPPPKTPRRPMRRSRRKRPPISRPRRPHRRCPPKDPAAGAARQAASASVPKRAHPRATPKRPARQAAAAKPARRR